MDDESIRVLLVEDNPGEARLIGEILTTVQDIVYSLEYVDRLSTGLEHLTAGDIDVVLLDLSLPDSQGLDTFARVHAQAPAVPVVILTGLEDEAIAAQAVRKGAQDYLSKGQMDSALLVRSIRYAMARKQAEQTLRKAHEELEIRVNERTAELAQANEELSIEITQRRRIEEELRKTAALDRVRVSVYEMRESTDIQSVLISLHGALKDAGVEFDDCSVQIVDEEKANFESYYLLPGRVLPLLENPLQDSAVYEAFRNERPVYRRDLDKEDPYNERTDIKEDVRSVLDVPFSYGTIAINSVRTDAFSEADIGVLKQFVAVLSEAYTRFEDIQRIEESEEKSRRRAALDHVRAEVFGMRTSEDMENVLTAICQELRANGATFDDCSINISKEGREPPEVESYCISSDRVWLSTASVRSSKQIEKIQRVGKPVYRRDLESEDVYREKETQDKAWKKRIRSIVDVPFSKGTFAINSVESDAFSAEDVELLGEFAEVLSEGYTRLEDIRRIEESEERYRAIFEQAADSIVLIDAETGALVEFNDRACGNLGYTREEFEELRIPDFGVTKSVEKVAQHIDKIMEQGTDTLETKHRKKDGEIRDIEVSCRAISIGGRNFIQSIWRDITEQKHAEEERRRKAALDRVRGEVLAMKTREDLERVVMAIGRELQAIGMRFDDCTISFVGEEAMRSGLGSSFVLSDRVGVVTPPDRPIEKDATAMKGAVLIEKMWRDGEVIYRPDLEAHDEYGEKEYIDRVWGKRIRSVLDVPFSQGTLALNSVEPNAFSNEDIEFLKDLAEVISEGYARFEDIQRTEESEERYRAIFEQAADSIVLMDAETGVLVEFNDRACENLGYTREEFEGLKIPDSRFANISGSF